jgi:hypothetical protein
MTSSLLNTQGVLMNLSLNARGVLISCEGMAADGTVALLCLSCESHCCMATHIHPHCCVTLLRGSACLANRC